MCDSAIMCNFHDIDMTDLPLECVEDILSYLSVLDQVICLEVCRMWSGLLRKLLAKQKELHIVGYNSRRRNTVTYSQLLQVKEIGLETLIYSVPNLEVLNISEVGLTAECKKQIICILSSNVFPLKHLDFGIFETDKISLSSFKQMIQQLSHLTSFRASFQEQSLGVQNDLPHTNADQYVECLIRGIFCKGLQTLNLDNSSALRTNPFFRLHLVSLKSLSLRGCTNISLILSSLHRSSASKTLEELDLRLTPSLHFPSVSSLLCEFSNIRVLYLPRSFGRCKVNTDSATGFSHLSCLSNLEVLSYESGFQYCMHAQDLEALSHCQRLKSLIVRSSVGHLSPSGFNYLRRYRKLEFLLLECDLPLMDEHLMIFSDMQHLRELHINYCPCLTLYGIQDLGVMSRSLEYLSLKGDFKIKTNSREFENFLKNLTEGAINRDKKLQVELFDIRKWDNNAAWKISMQMKYCNGCSGKLKIWMV